MATKEGKQWWDPYETSHRRQFVYRPNSATDFLLCPKSTSFIDSYSLSAPLGSTLYNKEFCWKPACKPECIPIGTASGQRRNNPHPSKSFMMWRLPRDATRSPEYVRFPWNAPPSEADIRKALTAQYNSTYRCDFVGMPQGYDHINIPARRLAHLHSRHHVPVSIDTEMRDSYRRPRHKPELLGSHSHYSRSKDPNVVCRVPTIVQRHAITQQQRADLTTYDRFCGKTVSDVTSVMKSLLHQELQQLHGILPEEEIGDVKCSSKDPTNVEEGSKLPAVNSCSPEWISSWTGPL